MKNQNSFNQFVNLINDTRNLSKHFSRIHELCVHQLDPENVSKEEQSDFYFLHQTKRVIKKIEKLAFEPGGCVSQVESQNLTSLIKDCNGTLSQSLISSHNRVCHFIDLMHFTPKVQSSLYFVFETAKILQAIEAELNSPNNGE